MPEDGPRKQPPPPATQLEKGRGDPEAQERQEHEKYRLENIGLGHLRDQIAEITGNAFVIKAPSLIHDLKQLGPEGRIPDEEPRELSADEWRSLARAFTRILTNRDQQHPYHNANHTLNGVVKRQEELMLLEEAQTGSPLLTAERQTRTVAAFGHDLGHPGMTIRPDQHIDGITNEEEAARLTDGILRSRGYTLRQRIQVYGMIIATTFTTPESPEWRKSTTPTTAAESQLVSADIAGFASLSMRDWIIESAHVLAEKPLAKRPATVYDWLGEQDRFLSEYVTKVMSPEAFAHWNAAYKEKLRMIKRLWLHVQLHGEAEQLNTVAEDEVRLLIREQVGPLLNTRRRS